MPLPAKRRNPIILIGIALVIIAEVLIITPSELEEALTSAGPQDPTVFIDDHQAMLAPGIPRDRIADYAVDEFSYVVLQNGQKQWKIEAARAFMYNPDRIVHSLDVRATLYDPEGAMTYVTGNEAKYIMNQKDLEIFGNVHTRFPDGFELHSEYLRYLPGERRIIIPPQYIARGADQQATNQVMGFVSQGMDYKMGALEIVLPKAVQVTMDRKMVDGSTEHTLIESDHCLIYKGQRLAKFTMDAYRPAKDRYVHITQPDLFTRSRRADLHYGDQDTFLKNLTAYEDVLVKETGKNSLRYGTGGQADFDTDQNVIILTQYPQVYQNNDTVTGDVILIHRDTDIVEVDHSNAYTSNENAPFSEPASPVRSSSVGTRKAKKVIHGKK